MTISQSSYSINSSSPVPVELPCITAGCRTRAALEWEHLLLEAERILVISDEVN